MVSVKCLTERQQIKLQYKYGNVKFITTAVFLNVEVIVIIVSNITNLVRQEAIIMIS